MTAKMFNDDQYRIIPTRIHTGGSIDEHTQVSGDDLNYIYPEQVRQYVMGKKKS